MVLEEEEGRQNLNSPASWLLARHTSFNIVFRRCEATLFGVRIRFIHFTVVLVVGEVVEPIPQTRVISTSILTYSERLKQT